MVVPGWIDAQAATAPYVVRSELGPAPRCGWKRSRCATRVLARVGVTLAGCRPPRATERLFLHCMSSEPFGQHGNRFKRGSGPSGLKLWLRVHDAAGVV